MFSLLPTPVNPFSFCNIVRALPEDAPVILYLPKPWIKMPNEACVQPPAQLPSPPSPMCLPFPAAPIPCGDRRKSARSMPAVGLVAISPVPRGPTRPRVGVGGSGDRTCRAGERGQNFPVFYPFATWSPIERNGSLRANRRGWPGSGPPARPRESCPLRGGKEL